MGRQKLFDRDPARVLISRLIEERDGLDMGLLSREIGRNHAYIQQFLYRGVPRKLPEGVRARLATALGIDESALKASKSEGGPATVGSATGARGIPLGAIPEIDAAAGAGGGGTTMIVDGVATASGGPVGDTYAAEAVRDWWRLPAWLLQRMHARPEDVIAFPTRGASMDPTIRDGDVIFIDTRHRVPSPPGIYALHDAFGGIVVKRLEALSAGDGPTMVKIASDNPRHETKVVAVDQVHILGIVVGKFTTPEAA